MKAEVKSINASSSVGEQRTKRSGDSEMFLVRRDFGRGKQRVDLFI